MSNHRFNLRLTREAKKILDQVEKGEKNKFINEAIEAIGERSFQNEALFELKNISSSLSTIAECMQNIVQSGGVQVNKTEQQKDTEGSQPDNANVQKKLSDFAMKYVEL